jgi:hypothetical protein
MATQPERSLSPRWLPLRHEGKPLEEVHVLLVLQ